MDELFTLRASGVFLRSEAHHHGYGDRDLRVARAQNQIHKVRVGSYVPTPVWQAAGEVERHLLRAEAVLLKHDGRVALSHTTGAAKHGLRLYRPDLRQIHVTRLDGGPGRALGDITYHQSAWEPDEVHFDGEGLVMSPTRCAYGSALLQGVDGGLVTLDSLFDLDLATPDEAAEFFEVSLRHHPRSAHVRMAHVLARPGSQSVGESLGRLLFARHGIPEPELQYEVRRDGRLLGICDWAWPEHRTYGEFDGKVKYGRLLKPGQDPGDVVFLEKQREDSIREATNGFMIRLTWPDLFRGRETAARVRAQLGRARRSA